MLETKQLFKRAAFNCIAMNCDDHVKNFGFMMDRQGNWKMAPAYDITFAFKPNNRWLGAHQMTLNGKSSGIGKDDLMEFGRNLELQDAFCRDSIEQITGIVGQWMTFAEKCGITEERAAEINNVLNQEGLG